MLAKISKQEKKLKREKLPLRQPVTSFTICAFKPRFHARLNETLRTLKYRIKYVCRREREREREIFRS